MTTWSVMPRSDRRRFCPGLVLLLLSLGSLPAPVFPAQASIFERVRTEVEAGRVDEAHKQAEAAVRRSPRSPQSHLALGTVLLAQGKTGEASKSFEFALALDPDVRLQVGEAYLAAVRRFSASNPDSAEACLTRAAQFDPELLKAGIEALFDDAFARIRAGDKDGRQLLSRWLTRFPDFEPSSEEDLFALAGYYEAEGKLSEAAATYGLCARTYPDGELGKRAAGLLRSRTMVVDRILSVPCAAQLFVVVRSLELSLTRSRANLSLVWVAEDRAGEPSRNLRLLPESRLETPSGESLAVVTGTGGSGVVGRNLELQTDAGKRLTLDFPPVPRGEMRADLVLENDVCGTSGRWGHHAIRFSDLPVFDSPIIPGQDLAGPREAEVSVVHIHDYFLAAGRCSGTLRFSTDGISYVSGPHGFELPCEDVIRVGLGSKTITSDPLGRIGEVGTVPTLLIEGRTVTKRGKPKTETWHFLAENGTPPVLLLSKNLCPSAR